MFNKTSPNSKIIYIAKGKLQTIPPCISQVVMLRELGYKVCVLIETCDSSTLDVLTRAGAEVKELHMKERKCIFAKKIMQWRDFNRAALKVLNENYSTTDLIWLGNETSAVALSSYIKNKPFVLTVLELMDEAFISTPSTQVFSKENSRRRLLALKNKLGFAFRKKKLKSVLPRAKAVVACEKNRARLMKNWYGLGECPFVMPNKPHFELAGKKTEDIIMLLGKLQNKKYILYQGILTSDRSLKTLAQALNMTKERYTLVVLGKAPFGSSDEILSNLRKYYSDIVYGGFFPAPQHLYVTEHSHIGVAFYDTSSLNNMFCAPNKIFEYSKFNVPIIGNDIPGLQLTVEKQGAGICVDMEEPNEIAKAIDKISENYEEYQNGVERLYNSVDNLETTRKILEIIGFMQQ